jgi:hypothetical protein
VQPLDVGDYPAVRVGHARSPSSHIEFWVKSRLGNIGDVRFCALHKGVLSALGK